MSGGNKTKLQTIWVAPASRGQCGGAATCFLPPSDALMSLRMFSLPRKCEEVVGGGGATVECYVNG